MERFVKVLGIMLHGNDRELVNSVTYSRITSALLFGVEIDVNGDNMQNNGDNMQNMGFVKFEATSACSPVNRRVLGLALGHSSFAVGQEPVDVQQAAVAMSI
ncbi:hypothetical protein LguiA_009002 [Lonicera macranthoides]